jgi:hypothetical protein
MRKNKSSNTDKVEKLANISDRIYALLCRSNLTVDDSRAVLRIVSKEINVNAKLEAK